MKAALTITGALVLLIAAPAYAHRLDEYLQATTISISQNRIEAEIHLTPGVAVFRAVLANIDADGDGLITEVEQRTYADQVLNDLVLTVDGDRLPLRLVSWKFASIDDMRQGRGEIQIAFDAAVQPSAGERHLILVNHHESRIAVYLVNALVSRDPEIRIDAQKRNFAQSFYQLDYTQRGASLGASPTSVRARVRNFFGDGGVQFVSAAKLGVRHIAEGTDHLMFLLVLLLPAPLIGARRRWGGYAGLQPACRRLLRIVTAFTIGHSLTLAAAALGWLHAPSRVVEVLIAISIFVSAVHAMRPIFPGREAIIAGGFGLVHGLAFATMIAGFGIDPWHTAITVFGFNAGIEVMQLVVVAAVVPWLVVLACTPIYGIVRSGGALVAAIAALGWIGERAFGMANPTGQWVESVAAHGGLFVGLLATVTFVASVQTRLARKANRLAG
jgi:hypothetical protein